MTDPVSIITTIGSAALTLKETIELVRRLEFSFCLYG